MSVEALSPAAHVSLLSAKVGNWTCRQETSGSRVQSPTLGYRVPQQHLIYNLPLSSEFTADSVRESQLPGLATMIEPASFH